MQQPSALCAAHPSLPFIAVAISGAGELWIFDARSLSRREDVVKSRSRAVTDVLDLAWHSCLAQLVVLSRGKIHILTFDRPECRFRFSSLTLQALGLGLGGSGLSRPTTATTAICWARKDQLLLGGDAFCSCRLDSRFSAGECEVQALADPMVHLQMETSERFLVSLHVTSVLRIWWAEEAPDIPVPRRRGKTYPSVAPFQGCKNEVLQHHCALARWAPSRYKGLSLALLVTLAKDDIVTVWRESSLDEACAFLPEARWSLSVVALSWVAPTWNQDEDQPIYDGEDKVPLRSTQHGNATEEIAESMQMVVMGSDSNWILSLTSSTKAPLKSKISELRGFCGPPVASRELCESGTFSCGGLLMVRLNEKSWDLWLCSTSGDFQRTRLEDGNWTMVAQAGAVIPSPEERVVSMAVHHDWGFVAILLDIAQGSLVWLSELPTSRGELASNHHVAEGRLHQDAIATLTCPTPLAALAWVPGRQVPPRLLAVACSGTLLGATMDATAASDVWKEVEWSDGSAVLAVQMLEVPSEENCPVALLVDEAEGPCCILAHVEANSNSLKPLKLNVVFRQRCSANLRSSLALEWFGDAVQLEAVAGQLAICTDRQHVHVMTLRMEDPATGAVKSSGPSIRAALEGDLVLQMALCDERLVALTSREVLVWTLEVEGQDAGLSYKHTLKGHVNRATTDTEDGTSFTGKMSLHRCAGGALLVLVTARSESFAVAPFVLMCQYGTTGYAWQVVDLHTEALPFDSTLPRAQTWTADGAILIAGHASAEGTSGRLTLITSDLPAAVQGKLKATVPCPAYHPDSLIHLLRGGQAALARRIMQQLLEVLRRGDRGISPVVGMSLEEFHCETPTGNEVEESTVIQSKTGASQTAADLFGDDDMEARLARLRQGWMSALEEDPESPKHETCEASKEDLAGWQLEQEDLEELSRYLQTTSLPVSAHAQARLLVLLQDIGATPHAGDLDESGQRFMKAFEVHLAVRRWQLRSPNSETFLQFLSSEDLCWALHSDCQGTMVDHILEALGTELEWSALRQVGLGLWLKDWAAVKKVLEHLPRVLLRRQGQELQPEAVALWYALLGRRTLLGQLYRQSKQQRVADFLSNDLSEEPWRTKAEKNAFELVSQRRFELACAFFIFAEKGQDAVDVCVRYMDDWPLALLIAHHVRAERAGSVAAEKVEEELRRVLLDDLLPVAKRAHDPWLASLIHWHLGDHPEAVKSVAQPCHSGDLSMPSGGPCHLFSAGALQHAGFSPGLPRFRVLLQGTLAKRNEVVTLPEVQEASSRAAIARAYLSRRQPLLALPPPSEELPWRLSVAVARAVMFLYCVSGQDLSELPTMLQALRRRLGLAKMSPAILKEVHDQVASEASIGMQIWEASTKVAEFYAPSQVRSWKTAKLPKKREKVAEIAGPSALWLLPCLAAPESHSSEELRLCLILRRLAEPYAARGFRHTSDGTMLAAVAWRVLPCLRSYMEAPEISTPPLAVMNLVVHVVCAACISLPPPTLCPEAEIEPAEPTGDMFHVVTTLVLVVILLLSLRGLTMSLSPEEDLESFSSIVTLLEEKQDSESFDGESTVRPPDWEPLLWQGLRVLLEHLKGNSTEQRRLLRCGALPSMVSTLFLEQSSREAAEAATTQGSSSRSGLPTPSSPTSSDSDRRSRPGRDRDQNARPEATVASLAAAVESSFSLARCLRNLLGCVVAELSLERLVLLLAGIRRRSANSSGHWITAWYDALVDSFKQLHKHVRSQCLKAAKEACDTFDRWPLALCAPEAQLSAVLASAFSTSADAFLALWRQLNGTRRLVLLFAHHPRLLVPSSKLCRQSAILWRGTSTSPAPRFLCCDRSGGALQVAVQVKGSAGPWFCHAGHAARWARQEDEERPGRRVEVYAMTALGVSLSSNAPMLDAAAEFLLGGASGANVIPASGESSEVNHRGIEVQHFLATLRLPADGEAAGRQGLSPRVPLVDAESHPFKSMFAAASEDGTVQLWSFGNGRLLRQLPRPVAAVVNRPKKPGAGAADLPEAGGPPGHWQLAWSATGNRLLAVQSAPGTSSFVNLWALEGDQLCATYSLQTGAAHARLRCATFASCTGAVVATGGRRADIEFSGPGGPATSGVKAWPHVAAGICVWDTTSPPSSSLIAHDGSEAAFSGSMPLECCCTSWVSTQQRLLCGTKTGELRAFDLRMKRWSQRLEAHSDPVRYCFVMESTGQVATLSDAAELKIWSLKHLELLDTIPALHHGRGVATSVGLGSKALSCAALLSERHLVTGGQDGTVVLTRL